MTLADIKPYIYWLQVHPHWAIAAIYAIALIECLPVIGLIMPGTVMMTMAGVAIGIHIVPAGTAIAAAILGGISGDVFSFFLGAYFHDRLREMWPFRFYPKLLSKGETFFNNHGETGVFIGRFIGPLRPIMPIVAGMLNMPTIRFLIADIFSGILWAPVYLLPGIIVGAASQQLPPEIATKFMLYVLGLLLILWCISWLLKKLIIWCINAVHNQLDRLWAAIKHKPFLKPISIALQDPQHPDGHEQLTLGLYWLLVVFLFLSLAINVMHQSVLTDLNGPLWNFMRTLRNDFCDNIMISITFLGEIHVISFVYLAMLVWLCFRKAWRTVVHWILLGILTFGGTEIFKSLVHSVRPSGLIQSPSGYSFPSGHATLSVSIIGASAFLIAKELHNNYRWISYLFTILVCLAIGISRIYLGAHWLTDVLGGYLLGLSILLFIILSYRRQLTPTLSVTGLVLITICSWAAAWGVFTYKHFTIAQHNYTPYWPVMVTNTSQWWGQQLPTQILYRTNRAGKVVGILNVEWAGQLTDIEQNLLQRGWKVSPNTTIGIILNRMAQQKQSVTLPLIPELYMDKRPVLVISKMVKPGAFLVMRLWDGKTTFSDSNLPLWLGTISYDHAYAKQFMHFHKINRNILTQPAIQALSNDLLHYTWKMVSYPQIYVANPQGDSDWNGYVILIKPSTLSDTTLNMPIFASPGM